MQFYRHDNTYTNRFFPTNRQCTVENQQRPSASLELKISPLALPYRVMLLDTGRALVYVLTLAAGTSLFDIFPRLQLPVANYSFFGKSRSNTDSYINTSTSDNVKIRNYFLHSSLIFMILTNDRFVPDAP